MIVNQSFLKKFIILWLICNYQWGLSQLNYTTSFNGCNSATCNGWTISGGISPSITSSSGTGYTPCSSASAKSNIYNATPTTLTSSNIGTSNGTAVTFSFSGKAINYSTGVAAAAGACSFQGFWSTDGISWTALNSLSSLASTNCNTYTFNTFTPPCNSPVYLRIVASRTIGDFWAVMDNIQATQIAVGPTGTITKTCIGDYSTYNATVQVSNLNGSSGVNISIGATTYFSNVGLGTYTIPGLTGINTINVSDISDACKGFSLTLSPCSICSDAPALPSNECVSAPLIDLSQAFVGSTNCTYTASAGSPSACGMSIENDSWMSFIAGATSVEIDFTIGDCSSNNGIQLSVFSGSCGSLTLIPGSCVNPTGENTTGSWNFSGLTIGSMYYIRIDGYAGDLCNYFFEPVSGVVTTPENDACSDAITLTCGSSHLASNILATAIGAPPSCSGGGSNPTGNGVWYKFVGNGQEMVVSTNNAGTNFNTRMNLYTATIAPYCSNLVCLGGADGVGNGAEYTFVSTSGINYYVYVSGIGASQGQFEIDLNCTPLPPCNANAGTWN